MLHSACVYVTTLYNEQLITVLSISSPEFPQHTIKKIIALKEDKRTMLLDVVGLVLLIPAFQDYLPYIASSPGPSQILSRSRGEKPGEGLGSLLRHGPEMVDSVSTNRVHITY